MGNLKDHLQARYQFDLFEPTVADLHILHHYSGMLGLHRPGTKLAEAGGPPANADACGDLAAISPLFSPIGIDDCCHARSADKDSRSCNDNCCRRGQRADHWNHCAVHQRFQDVGSPQTHSSTFLSY